MNDYYSIVYRTMFKKVWIEMAAEGPGVQEGQQNQNLSSHGCTQEVTKNKRSVMSRMGQ